MIQETPAGFRFFCKNFLLLTAVSLLPIINQPETSSGCSSHEAPLVQLGQQPIPRGPRLPPWLKRNLPPASAFHYTADLIKDLRLETVCESAKCPNRLECWSSKTATLMILGNVCTRPCGFCSVPKGKTEALELDEPERVAEAAERLGLKHVVITSVTRDDLADGGAEHFYQTVLAVRRRTGAVVEVLTPDFIGKPGALERVVESAPEVFNHNTETVPRLYREVRGRKSVYSWTLELLRRVKELNPAIKTKSGLMLGLGETRDELLDVLADLRSNGVDYLTLGQYLQPTLEHLPSCAICHLRSSTNSAHWLARSASSKSPAAHSFAVAITRRKWSTAKVIHTANVVSTTLFLLPSSF